MAELIAYRDIDLEGDVWSERVFMFKDRDAVDAFFTETNETLIQIYGEGVENLCDFEAVRSNSGFITSIEFTTEYAGKVKIREMQQGYLIN